MIKFCCKNCGQKISAPEIHVGKKGKCPKCKNIVVVPARPEAQAKSISTVRFTCSTCNQEIEEPETSRGKLVECPHCGSYAPVPSEKIPAQKAEALVQPGKEEGVFEKRPEAPQEPETEIEAEEAEPVTQRKLPWIIDIFLYPTSPSGLISLIIIVVIPMLIALVSTLMGPLGIAVGLPGFFLNLAIGLYMLWFFTECVRDSANGGTRAPEAFATSSLGDMWSQALHIIGCYLILLGPVGFYHIFTQKTDAIFWLLLAYGAFLFPMGLLACIMFDSVRGLNPILLVGSIFSTFFHYFGLVLLIVAIVLAFSALPGWKRTIQNRHNRLIYRH
ncbi:MAG: hypothetical protein ACYTBX_15485 [Planctomycetota bacterium]|jgi:DNA-directed RNA polymerase subunit RPC12/RpoP